MKLKNRVSKMLFLILPFIWAQNVFFSLVLSFFRELNASSFYLQITLSKVGDYKKKKKRKVDPKLVTLYVCSYLSKTWQLIYI